MRTLPLLTLGLLVLAAPAAAQRHAVLLAGDRAGDHPAGTHEYLASLQSLVRDLEPAGVRCTVVEGGWPEDEALLDDADTIVLYSDGADRDPSRHPLLAEPGRVARVDELAERGCGVVVLHWATIVPNDGIGDRYLEWIGGHFDHQTGDAPNGWRSRITHAETTAHLDVLAHPIQRGLPVSWTQRDEWYYALRVRPGADPILFAELEGRSQLVAWAYESPELTTTDPTPRRGFGFTGGHHLDNFEDPDCRRLLLNAILWTAGAEVPEDGVPVTPRPVAVPGRFGAALDCRATEVAFAPREHYGAPPLTVEAFVRADDPRPFQVFVSNQDKSSGGHWELYAYAGPGDLSVYLPGYTPSEIRSGASICDGAWHHVGFTFDREEVALYLDGREVARRSVAPNGRPERPGPLYVGGAVDGARRIRCTGAVDEVRVSSGLRDLTRVPDAPHVADGTTVGLWRFDETGPEGFRDHSAFANPSAFVAPPAWTPRISDTPEARPYEVETDADWHDDRIRRMDTGPFLMHSILVEGVPGRAQVNKALALKLEGGFHVLYDLETMELVAGWSGPFLEFSDVRFGLLNKPRAGARTVLGPPVRFEGQVSFRELRLEGGHVLLVYEVDGEPVHEQVYFVDGVVQRRFGVGPLPDGEQRGVEAEIILVRVHHEPTAARYAPVETQLVRGEGPGPYVVDTLTLPHKNAWGALVYASGVGFLPNGDGVVCAAHGDVWTVSDIDSEDGVLAWRRFATGLYQPLGLQVVDGEVLVLARDRIWRLEDRNGDGEADRYVSFNASLEVTGADHAYAMDLERGPDGALYFQKSGGLDTAHGGSTLRLDPTGATLEVVAHGFRHANGIGVSPDGVVTNGDNEGNFIPATRINWMPEPGYHGGYQPSYRGGGDPASYDPPLCWLPRVADSSAGGQRWVEGDRWGLPSGAMLHTSFGHARLLLVLHETANGVEQGGVVALPFTFLSGVCRGRFRPQDGQLYLAGLDGWQTAAVRDGCLQRVRYVGGPVRLPVALETRPGELRLTFTDPLDTSSVNATAFDVSCWSYRYSRDYGSKEWSVADPTRQGHDPVAVEGARLAADGCTVVLSIPDLTPVMQQRVVWRLRGADGAPVEGTLHHTIHHLESR